MHTKLLFTLSKRCCASGTVYNFVGVSQQMLLWWVTGLFRTWTSHVRSIPAVMGKWKTGDIPGALFTFSIPEKLPLLLAHESVSHFW